MSLTLTSSYLENENKLQGQCLSTLKVEILPKRARSLVFAFKTAKSNCKVSEGILSSFTCVTVYFWV